jgi:predicted Rossmann fold flavoprotein
VLAARLPASVATQILGTLEVDAAVTMAHLAREERRRLAHALTAWPMPIAGSRGFNYAEATAGGISLDEIEPATMESRVCPGLYLAGEVLDVDGRLGGFNFQWAWASGYVAGRGVTK